MSPSPGNDALLDDAPSQLRHVASALPDLVFAVGCLFAWVRPRAVGPDVLRAIMVTMLLEFIVVHSAAFMGVQIVTPGPRARRTLKIVGLGLFYSLFAGAFALSFHTWRPLAGFWLLVLNRLSVVWMRQAPTGAEVATVQASWAAGGICYLVGVFVTLVPFLPRLGFDDAIVAAMHLQGRGAWVSQPWRVVAFASLYFGAMGAFELNGFRALVARTPEARMELSMSASPGPASRPDRAR